MKEFIDIYHNNKEKVENFLEDSIINVGHLSEENNKDNFKKLFKTFTSLELVYVVDEKTKTQTSANIYPKKIDEDHKGEDRTYLLEKLNIKETGFGFSLPYQSKATKNLCITVTKKEKNKIIYMDFKVSDILEGLGLIEKHKLFSKIEKTFYATVGVFMMAIAITAILYSGFSFFNTLKDLNLEHIFKPIITLTLGLAIFDLAKTVLMQEVFFKSYSRNEIVEIKVLGKFLFTILIALSIETLMVVFKLAMQEKPDMINALYIMSGTALTIIAIAIFIKLTKEGKGKHMGKLK